MALQTSKRNKALLTPDFCSAKPILDADLQNCKTIDLCCFELLCSNQPILKELALNSHWKATEWSPDAKSCLIGTDPDAGKD